MSEHGAARRPGPTVKQARPIVDPPAGLNRCIWVAYGVLGVLLAVYMVSEILRRDGQSSQLIDGWGVALFEVIVSLLCIARALFTRGDRRVPLVLGLGLLSWSVGDIVLTAESMGGATPPTPSLADAFYLGFYPLTYAGVFLLARGEVKKFSVSTWLDGAVAGLGVAAICAQFALRGLPELLHGPTASVLTNVAYPVGDLSLLALVVAGSTVLPGRRKAPWLLLAVGYAINALGDTFNLFQSTGGATHVGTLFNAVAWPTAIFLVSLSVWLPSRRSRGLEPEPLPGLVIPGVAALAALVILGLSSFVEVNRVAFALASCTLVLAAIRSGLSLVRLRT